MRDRRRDRPRSPCADCVDNPPRVKLWKLTLVILTWPALQPAADDSVVAQPTMKAASRTHRDAALG